MILDGAYKAGEVVAEKVRTVPALGTLINPGTYLLSDDIFLADAMEHLPKANKRISEFIHEQWEAGMSSPVLRRTHPNAKRCAARMTLGTCVMCEGTGPNVADQDARCARRSCRRDDEFHLSYSTSSTHG